MKENIKRILREGIETNSLGVKVTKPTQELIIMRGIPGAGKSTKAKELVGSGQIFSTDDRIESQGDYREFFKKMIDNKNFAPLSKVHNLNFNMAKKAMEDGVSPVVVDNTNIKANEPKNYIEAALNMGYADNNIKFIEVGTGGLSAEELANRNTHGVPLDKIEAMIQSYKSVGPLTLEKVIKAKDMYSNKPKMFASLVPEDSSAKKLVEATKQYIPEGWKIFAHHMTINYGKGLPEHLKGDLGQDFLITATEIGISDMAVAVRVVGYYSDNDIPHITIAVNTSGGGKPVMSNKITNWRKLENYINLSGKVSEEKLG